jgi:pimeloyl-ACP methyl ester carboxylesterase
VRIRVRGVERGRGVEQRQEVRTPDGRRLVFHVAGPQRGELVIFHTGTPGSPDLPPVLGRECEARGLRIACIARPGYAGSERLRGRVYADNPADTALVADRLGAETFYVAGHSGGGGPALADAVLLPDRVRAAAVSASFAPRPAMGPSWWDGVELANGDELAATEAGESALRAYLEERAAAMREVKRAADILDNPEFSRLYAAVDQECFRGDFLDYVVKTYPLSVSHGVDGWIDDNFALLGDWGFDLNRVGVPVAIWQGGQDNIIPAAHGEWLAANVPGGRYRFLPDEGHVSLLNHFSAILDDLLERAG